MQRFLIDANVPRVPSIWSPPTVEHALDLPMHDSVAWTDTQIWDLAVSHGYTLVSRDADFTNRVLVSRNAPHVVHIRLGNMRLVEFRQFIEGRWSRIAKLSADFRIVNIYRNRIEQRD